MNQNDWDIIQTRNASKRKVGDVHTSLTQWHQGIGGHGYVKLGVAKGVHFNLHSELRRLSDSISHPKPPKPVKPTRVGIGGTVNVERRDASGILLPTAHQRRYTPLPTPGLANPYGLKPINLGFTKERMD